MIVLITAIMPPTAMDPVMISPTRLIITNPMTLHKTAFTTVRLRVSIPIPKIARRVGATHPPQPLIVTSVPNKALQSNALKITLTQLIALDNSANG